MTRSRRVALALLAALATTATAQDRGLLPGERIDRVPARSRMAINANPTALIAAEIALGKLAAKKGELFALRETAAPGARLMRPDPVDAAQWLQRAQEPAARTKWDGQAVWMSCDGAIGVVEGEWSRPGASGRFATVWQRQDKGGYKWLLRQDEPGQADASPLADMLLAVVADCPERSERRPPPEPARRKTSKSRQAPPPIDALTGYSPDKSLYWHSASDATGARRLLVRIGKDGTMKTVLGAELEVPPSG